MCRELKEAYEAEAKATGLPRLLLTAAVAAGRWTIEPAYQVRIQSHGVSYDDIMVYHMMRGVGGWGGEKTCSYSCLIFQKVSHY